MPVDMKAMIAGTYLQLVQHGNVDKITVKALIDACHISRQTFYYHFRDIMDVLEWSIQRETARLVEETLQVEGMGQALKLFISFSVERFPLLRRLLDSQKRVQLEAIMLGPEKMAQLWALKRQLDPQNLLGPGNVLTEVEA